MNLERPREYYPATLEEIREALRAAGVSGRPLRMLTTHVAIENGCGGGACTGLANNNLGNISLAEASTKNAPHWRPPWYPSPTDETPELYRALHAQMLEGKAPSAFRAYDSLEDGARAYADLLRRRYPAMLNAPTPEAFVKEWASSGYTYGLNEAATLRTFRQIYDQQPAQGGAGWILTLATAIGGVLWLKKK